MRNKHKLNKLKKDYIKVPNRILSMGLKPGSIATYLYLAKMPEDFNPAISIIARAINVSKNSVLKYLDELKNRNIIYQYERGAEHKFSKYQFNDVKDWK